MSATALTHDVKTTHSSAAEVNLPGQPFGLRAEHDPAQVFGVATRQEMGPGAAVLGANDHANVEERLSIELAEVPQAVVDDLLVVLGYCRLGWPVVYSPLGSASYGASEYLVTTSIRDWRETSFARWAGTLELQRNGGAY